MFQFYIYKKNLRGTRRKDNYIHTYECLIGMIIFMNDSVKIYCIAVLYIYSNCLYILFMKLEFCWEFVNLVRGRGREGFFNNFL